MEVIKVSPRGYCKGVTKAIAIARKTAQQYPDKTIYVLGMLVHNRYVIEALAKLGIHTVDDKRKSRMELLDEIPADSVVIFTAHGIAPQVKRKAQQRGLICVDASCQDVLKTQELVKERLAQGYEVLYIGKKQHPEAEAVCWLSTHVHLITQAEDIEGLPAYEKIFVTNQTTMSVFDIEALFSSIKKKFPDALFCEEICNATRIRQQAVADLKTQHIDVLYVVGDKHSNNSGRLAQIGKEQGIPHVYRIDDVSEIEDAQLINAKRVGVTSGASTPTYLTSQVITYLESYHPQKEKPAISVSDIF